jgi:ketosteroid isomerase-like protein
VEVWGCGILAAMSIATSDALRSYFRTFESGGVNAAAEFWHPEIEWRAIENAADDVGVIRGHDALRSYYEDWIDTLADLRAEVEEILFEADDRVAVVVRNSGRGRASGAAAEGRYYVACVIRAGRIVTGREYATREKAIEAIGLLT